MSMIKGKDTKPEIILRHSLHAKGFRYRKNVKSLPGKPDIVLAKYRTVIFVNGCFWHGHMDCSRYVTPKSNTAFWENKIKANKERDLVAIQKLESLDWNVITVWECQLGKATIDEAISSIIHQLKTNQCEWESYQERRRLNRQIQINQARDRRQLQERVLLELKNQ